MTDMLINLIPTIGFPCVCLIACGLFIYKMWGQEQKQQETREMKMMSQIEKFSDTLDKFNTTLTKIDTRLEIVENSLK